MSPSQRAGERCPVFGFDAGEFIMFHKKRIGRTTMRPPWGLHPIPCSSRTRIRNRTGEKRQEENLLAPALLRKKPRPISGYGMPENHAQNHQDYPRANQVKHRGSPPPRLRAVLPFLTEKIPEQDVSGGIGRRPREIVNQKSAPRHF